MKKSFKTKNNQITKKINTVIKNTKGEIKNSFNLQKLNRSIAKRNGLLNPLELKKDELIEKNWSGNKIMQSLFAK